VTEGLPLNTVEKRIFCHFSKHNVNISVKTLKEVMCTLFELVEPLIDLDMATAGCGATMHDAWTKFKIHYMAMFACYIRKAKAVVEGEMTFRNIPMCTLVYVAPMAQVDKNDNILEDDAADFKAETMKAHQDSIYTTFYPSAGLEWSLANIADNTSVNLKLCRLQCKPHVGCKNHLVAVDFNDMIKGDTDLEENLAKVNDTMVKIKNSLKNTAVLRLLTPLRPSIDHPIRWTGKYRMATRFIKLHPKLIKLASHPASTLAFENDSPTFLNRIKKATGWMGEVNMVTVGMQRDGITLAECDFMLEGLHKMIHKYKDQRMMIGTRVNTLHHCPFRVNKVRSTYVGELNPDRHFVTGVIKIQRGDWCHLTEAEIRLVLDS
jgi:hypothetical protein